MTATILDDPIFLSDTLKRLAILDYGLFQVHENRRVIGIPGYLLQSRDGRNILVDTGFPSKYVDRPDEAAIEDGLESFGRILHLTRNNLPAGQLARCGLTPADIDEVILTHSDIDHVGGLDLFTRAPIVVGAAEHALPRPRYFEDHAPLDWPPADYRHVHEDTVLCPGLAILHTPGHSPGHLSLAVRLAETGTVLIFGDAIARPAELETGVFGGAWDQAAAAVSAARLMALAESSAGLIIFGHDPAQWETLRKAPAYYD